MLECRASHAIVISERRAAWDDSALAPTEPRGVAPPSRRSGEQRSWPLLGLRRGAAAFTILCATFPPTQHPELPHLAES